jgi:hypothetical protein
LLQGNFACRGLKGRVSVPPDFAADRVEHRHLGVPHGGLGSRLSPACHGADEPYGVSRRSFQSARERSNRSLEIEGGAVYRGAMQVEGRLSGPGPAGAAQLGGGEARSID